MRNLATAPSEPSPVASNPREMTTPSGRKATRRAARIAGRRGYLANFDPKSLVLCLSLRRIKDIYAHSLRGAGIRIGVTGLR